MSQLLWCSGKLSAWTWQRKCHILGHKLGLIFSYKLPGSFQWLGGLLSFILQVHENNNNYIEQHMSCAVVNLGIKRSCQLLVFSVAMSYHQSHWTFLLTHFSYVFFTFCFLYYSPLTHLDSLRLDFWLLNLF